MKFLVPAFFASLFSVLSFAQDRKLAPVEIEIQRLIQDAALKHGSVSFTAVNLDNGKVIADHNAFKAMVPASLAKLSTTWIALKQLGENHVFKTRILHTGEVVDGTLNGNLIVVAGGDPSLGSRYVSSTDPMVKIKTAISEAGIQSVNGKLIIDESIYHAQTTPRGWIWEDMGNYFGASPTALMWKDNLIELYLNSGQVGTPVVLAKPWPEDSPYELSFDIKSADNNKDDAWFFSAPYATSIYGKGTIPASKTNFLVKIADPDPVYSFVRDFKAATGINEIEIERSRTERDYANANTLLEITSPPLGDLIALTNKQSINLYAEALNIALDASVHHKTVEGGLESMDKYLKKMKVTQKGTRQIDGSGNSPSNKLTGQFMIDLLGGIYRDEAFPVFYESLGVGGQSGTVKWYFKNGEAAGNLHAKSGSMTGVRNYAGYVKNKYDETIAFCLMMNDYDENRKAALMKKFETIIEACIQD
ncbi:MAG: D-alanyl-D-alanine carboxypeptidase/D-alanyl-D-alanine-endopeptidase [Salibacteraceae bacterium]